MHAQSFYFIWASRFAEDFTIWPGNQKSGEKLAKSKKITMYTIIACGEGTCNIILHFILQIVA